MLLFVTRTHYDHYDSIQSDGSECDEELQPLIFHPVLDKQGVPDSDVISDHSTQSNDNVDEQGTKQGWFNLFCVN